MSGYDVYVLFSNLMDMFTEEKKFNIPIPNDVTLSFIKGIKNDSYKIMYKNIMSILSVKEGKKKTFPFTNELLLNKYFSKHLLKNYKESDFIHSKNDKTDKNDKYNILIDIEVIKKALINNKKIIINNYNLNFDLKYDKVEDFLDNTYNI